MVLSNLNLISIYNYVYTEQTLLYDGMGPSEACHFYEKQILKRIDSLSILANGSINPTKNVAYHLHNIWRNENWKCYFPIR